MKTFYENKPAPVTATIGNHLSPAAHLHNHLELVYLLEGQSYAFADEKQYEMHAGDVFLAFPNQVHGYPKMGDGTAKNILLIFSPSVCSEFKTLFRHNTPTSSLVPAKDIDAEILLLAQKILAEQQNKAPYFEPVTRGYLIALLGKLFCSMEFREEKKSDGILLKDLLNYCNAHYTEPLSLDLLASELSTGKHYISHIFNERLKISFPDYVNGLRINEATRLLLANPDRNVTEIAYDCGFSSTRTFNRAFIKQIGLTPRDFRKKNRNKSVLPIDLHTNEA